MILHNIVLADLGLHVVGLGYQRTLGTHVAGQLAVESYTPWTQNIDLWGLSGPQATGDTTGVLLRGRVFLYPLGEAPSGPWLSPFVQAGPGWATRDGQRRTGSLAAAGASAGYAGFVGSRIHLAFGLGAQYHVASYPGGEGAPSFARFYPTLDGSVGYGF